MPTPIAFCRRINTAFHKSQGRVSAAPCATAQYRRTASLLGLHDSGKAVCPVCWGKNSASPRGWHGHSPAFPTKLMLPFLRDPMVLRRGGLGGSTCRRQGPLGSSVAIIAAGRSEAGSDLIRLARTAAAWLISVQEIATVFWRRKCPAFRSPRSPCLCSSQRILRNPDSPRPSLAAPSPCRASVRRSGRRKSHSR